MAPLLAAAAPPSSSLRVNNPLSSSAVQVGGGSDHLAASGVGEVLCLFSLPFPIDGEGEDGDEEDRERDEQAGDLLQEVERIAEEGLRALRALRRRGRAHRLLSKGKALRVLQLQFLEVIRLEGHGFHQDDIVLSRDMYLLQLCSGVDENSVGACAQLVFAPIDESFADDAPLLPSGFRVIPLDPKTDTPATTRTFDLASTLEVGSGAASRAASETASNSYNLRSVLTIAFQFTYENHLQENVGAMARQYVRSVVASVQRVAMAIAPSRLGTQLGVKHPPGSPEAQTLARWISRSYRLHTGVELLRADTQSADSLLKLLWHHSDAIMCCSLKASPIFTFANQAGLDMLETTLVALQDISLEKILDDGGRKALCSEFAKLMQQGFAYLQGFVIANCLFMALL